MNEAAGHMECNQAKKPDHQKNEKENDKHTHVLGLNSPLHNILHSGCHRRDCALAVQNRTLTPQVIRPTFAPEESPKLVRRFHPAMHRYTKETTMPENNQRFEQLKQKYQSVQNAMSQNQVRLQNLNMQGDKLFMRAEAASEQAKNKIWDQIKLIDPTYSDLIADITVNASAQAAPRTQSAGASASGGQSTRTYTVQPGDTLSKISKQFYGNANDYMKIFNANKDRLHNPNEIRSGQELVIPE